MIVYQIPVLYRWAVILLLSSCVRPASESSAPVHRGEDTLLISVKDTPATDELPDSLFVRVGRAVHVEDYFTFMDSIITSFGPAVDYPLTEHLLVHANTWILDTLVNTDYYYQLQQGNFVYDQRKLTVLKPGDSLYIPGKDEVATLQHKLNATFLDVNIPEYTLRIYRNDTVLYSFPVRVGRNSRRYLKTAGREVDLRTPIGIGKIVRIDRDPDFVDPVTGKAFSTTQRDDGRRTMMPQIPWLEPEINGIRSGALIHPTTNPITLGKAYSNGCIGTPEGAAWLIYYHAPVGTKVVFRYDLRITDQDGNDRVLEDIY